MNFPIITTKNSQSDLVFRAYSKGWEDRALGMFNDISVHPPFGTPEATITPIVWPKVLRGVPRFECNPEETALSNSALFAMFFNESCGSDFSKKILFKKKNGQTIYLSAFLALVILNDDLKHEAAQNNPELFQFAINPKDGTNAPGTYANGEILTEEEKKNGKIVPFKQ